MDKKNLRVMIVTVVVFLSLLLFVIGSVLLFGGKDKKKGGKAEYDIAEVDIYKDFKVTTSEKLKKEHCLDKICINDLTIYQDDGKYDIVFKIKNTGSLKKSGYLKVVFGNRPLTVKYTNLKGKSSTNYTIQLGKYGLGEVDDFEVRELTDKELSKIKRA